MRLLSQEEMGRLLPAETRAFPGPIPTQIVSSEEYFPTAQTAQQQQVEARTRALGDELGRRHGLSRRAFFRTDRLVSCVARPRRAMCAVNSKVFISASISG